ncbi:MAG: hypothetical protein ACTSQA_08965 [Candidatus Heimdallarchaeaceae archaeon]
MNTVTIKYGLMNRKTNSVITGKKRIAGESFHQISDDLTGILENAKEKLLKRKFSGEDPSEWHLLKDWEVLGFVDNKIHAARRKRARRNMQNIKQEQA